MRQPVWYVVRTDDNGADHLMRAYPTEEAAVRAAAAYEKLGHKNTYRVASEEVE